MKANIITIGDEILIGQIVDTNSAWLAEKLTETGISIHRIISISDNRKEIVNALDESLNNADITILTGGLGPTKDDITKIVLNEYFKGNLVFHEPTMNHINKLFVARGLEVNEFNEKQAHLPDVCEVLPNNDGTAPGMLFNKNKRIVISLPGVPFEMKTIVTDQVLPRFKKRIKLPVIYNKTILTQGIAESILSKKINQWEESLPSTIKLAYLPSPGIVRLRISVQGENIDILREIVSEYILSLNEIIGDYIFGYEQDTLESIIGELLSKFGQSLSTSESCTGGALAAKITSVSGSSKYFKGSVVAYDNMVKINTLKVTGEDVINFGAVSKQVVEQMAIGVRELFNTDYAVSTSGVAGPTGGSDEKPVGTVWIAISSKNAVISKKFLFGEHRGRNIIRSVYTALNMLRKVILENN